MNYTTCKSCDIHVKDRLRQIMSKVFILLFVCVMLTPGIAQEKTSSGKPLTNKIVKSPKIIVRVKSKGDFIGTVTHINIASKTITLKNKGIIVTFDVLNPVLKGYQSLEQIRVGDKIAISYTGNSARITKATGKRIILQHEITKTKPEAGKQKNGAVKINKKRPVRVIEKSNSSYFHDVDNNDDGRISPVELSAIVHDITVEDFKKYDKNGDGCLSESEYNAINKSVTRRHGR